MITVACVLRSGGVYTPEYVTRLAAAVARYLPDSRFVCLSNMSVPDVRVVRLRHRWPGWWAKMELFRPGRLDGGQLVLYLDIDVLLLGDLSSIQAYQGRLACLADLFRPDTMISSSVMLWRGPAMRRAWLDFVADPDRVMREHPSRMDHFLKHYLGPGDRIQDLWPGLVVSYKRDCRKQGAPPEGAAIIDFHGRPKIPNLEPDHWARHAWARFDATPEAA